MKRTVLYLFLFGLLLVSCEEEVIDQEVLTGEIDQNTPEDTTGLVDPKTQRIRP